MKQSKQISRKVYRTSKTPEIPINTKESNAKGDQLALAACISLIIGAVAVLGLGGYWSISGLIRATDPHHLNWASIFGSIVIAIMSFLIARALVNLSFFGAATIAVRMGAWKSLEIVTRQALKLQKILPNSSAWASMILAQSFLSRGEYKQALAIAEDEWKRFGEDKRQNQNMGPLCAAAGMASQADGDYKTTLVWNDRAIAKINAVLEELNSPKKTLFARALALQSGEVTAQLRIPLAAACFNNACIYFNSMDYRRAKENYRKTIENAVKAPDFPNKAEIIKTSNDQLARLKSA